MLKRAVAGDAISAAEWNKLVDVVNGLAAGGSGDAPRFRWTPKFVELEQDLPGGPLDEESSADESHESVEHYEDRSAAILTYNHSINQWIDSGLQIDNLTNCFFTPYFIGERLWVIDDPQSGKHVPLSPSSMVRLVKTVGPVNGDGFGKVEFYSGTLGSEVGTGITVRVYDRYQDLENRVWGHVVPAVSGDGWDLIAGDCEDPGESDSSISRSMSSST